MSEQFKRVWHDPVWSKVIAWGICGVLAAIGAIIWAYLEGWRTAWGAIASMIRALWRCIEWVANSAASWLLTSWGIPRLIVLVVIALFVGITVWLYVRVSSTERQLAKSNTEKAGLRGAAASDERSMWDARAAQRNAETDRDQAVKKVAELEQRLKELAPSHQRELGTIELRIMRELYSHYPHTLQTRSISGQVFQSYPVCERHLDQLVDNGLVRRVRGTYTSDAGFTLTTEGRDFCIAQNL